MIQMIKSGKATQTDIELLNLNQKEHWFLVYTHVLFVAIKSLKNAHLIININLYLMYFDEIVKFWIIFRSTILVSKL